MQIKKIEKGGRKNDDNNSNPGNINIDCKCHNHLHRFQCTNEKNNDNQLNINLDNINLWSNYSIKNTFFNKQRIVTVYLCLN